MRFLDIQGSLGLVFHQICIGSEGNVWDYESRPKVMRTLGYPLAMTDRIPDITVARNIELGLKLQLSFLHPSKHKFEHPRFSYEPLEYVGQLLLIKDLDAPGKWLAERYRRVLMNKFCGRYLREKRLHQFVIFPDPVHAAVQQALHGLACRTPHV
ncbi:hypothetical protein D8674_020164 [Pyrus ussuriensis x Pyrus communis]|uniref:Uncharacterized protein n=1 Tax=Pyrus ussuriensis x Pyrus communis TaxID=2448454 RepID=A0A5N5HEX6_9ROSA|nr:hypothetical protein D8674_020164 [Pyrus ussuriensis x Pyrus communis]